MERRSFLKKASVGLAAGAAAGVASTAAVAAPAVQTGLPEIKWRMTSSFPKSIDTLYGSAELLANRLREITGGKFDIRIFPAGEIVPGLQALDAVQQGTVEMCHSCSYYYVGKDKTFGFGTAVPFGMNARQMNAWIYRRRRPGAARRVLRQLQRVFLPRRQHRRADGRLVPQADQHPGGHQGPEDPHRRHRRRDHVAHGRDPAADRRLGHLPLARERHHRRRRVGRPLRRREARLLQGRAELLLAGSGGSRAPSCTSM